MDIEKVTLVNSYKENIDYKIIKGKPKCFKLMAMQSKTRKAIQIRKYYYELEHVIDHHYQ